MHNKIQSLNPEAIQNLNYPRIHRLKIHDKYYRAILKGTKNFEVRLNDRNYQVGDVIEFIVINDSKLTIYTPNTRYMITYILKDFIGLKIGYVVFGITIYEV